MENFFITQQFDWQPAESWKVEALNGVLKKLGRNARLTSPLASAMSSVEQRMNLYHFVSQVLAYDVPGELVEVGCYTGQLAALVRQVADYYDPTRELHVYDSFEDLQGQHETNVRAALLRNFEQAGVRPPVIHAGWFCDTLPTGLPERICFAHIDAGPGGSFENLKESVLTALTYVYPRLSPGAICVLMDYCDPEIHDGWNENPGVKAAADEFFADKDESVSPIFAGRYSQGYFRRQVPVAPAARVLLADGVRAD